MSGKLRPETQAVVDEAYDNLVSAFASAMLAAKDDGATPENVATFARYADRAFDLIAGISPEHEKPSTTLLMMAVAAESRARELVEPEV